MGNRNNNGSLFHQLINAPELMERQDLSLSRYHFKRERIIATGVTRQLLFSRATVSRI